MFVVVIVVEHVQIEMFKNLNTASTESEFVNIYIYPAFSQYQYIQISNGYDTHSTCYNRTNWRKIARSESV